MGKYRFVTSAAAALLAAAIAVPGAALAVGTDTPAPPAAKAPPKPAVKAAPAKPAPAAKATPAKSDPAPAAKAAVPVKSDPATAAPSPGSPPPPAAATAAPSAPAAAAPAATPPAAAAPATKAATAPTTTPAAKAAPEKKDGFFTRMKKKFTKEKKEPAKKDEKKSEQLFLQKYRVAYDLIYNDKNYDKGIVALRALRHDEHPDVANLIGFSSRKLGRTDDAKVWYEKALAADPKHTRTWQYYGLWHLEQGNRLKAEEHLDKIATICGTECEDYKSLKLALVTGNANY